MVHTPGILALDLEGTLISNAMSQFPRPGLRAFLETAFSLFTHVVVLTAVGEERTRLILRGLLEEEIITFEMPYVQWYGEFKDLSFVKQMFTSISLDAMWLVDDLVAYVAPTQRSQWFSVQSWVTPYDPGIAFFLT